MLLLAVSFTCCPEHSHFASSLDVYPFLGLLWSPPFRLQITSDVPFFSTSSLHLSGSFMIARRAVTRFACAR